MVAQPLNGSTRLVRMCDVARSSIMKTYIVEHPPNGRQTLGLVIKVGVD